MLPQGVVAENFQEMTLDRARDELVFGNIQFCVFIWVNRHLAALHVVLTSAVFLTFLYAAEYCVRSLFRISCCEQLRKLLCKVQLSVETGHDDQMRALWQSPADRGNASSNQSVF